MKKRTVLCFVLALLLSLCACGQASVGQSSSSSSSSTAPIWQEQYDLGLRYLSEGSYEEAIIAFTAAIEIDPKQAPAYVGRGDAYTGVAQLSMVDTEVDTELTEDAAAAYQKAVADYLEAIELDESTAEVYRKAAEVYMTLGDLDSAVALLERGVAATGDNDLQAYLDELKAQQSLFVLTRQDIYLTMEHRAAKAYHPGVEYHRVFTYDEAGYLASRYDTDIYEDSKEIHDLVTWSWSYDEESNTWLRERTEDGESETERIVGNVKKGQPEMVECDTYVWDVYANPFTTDAIVKGYTARYTYDENGNAIRIDTYNSSGALSGYCILTWEEIHPVSLEDLR